MKRFATVASVLILTGFLEIIHAQSIKFEETFTSETPPPGWQVIDNDGSGDAFLYVSALVDNNDDTVVVAQAGEFFWESNFENANANLIDEWLIGPKIDGIQEGDSLSFFAGGADPSGFPDSLKVWISTQDSSLPSFTNEIAYFRVEGDESYEKYTFDLSPFAGEDIFFAVNYYHQDGGPTGNSSLQVWIDHFIVTGNPVTHVDDMPSIAENFQLSQNYPNPFNPSTKITFFLPQSAEITLKVFNVLGQELTTVIDNEQYTAGEHAVIFDAAGLKNGVYFYRLVTENFVDIKKMTVLK